MMILHMMLTEDICTLSLYWCYFVPHEDFSTCQELTVLIQQMNGITLIITDQDVTKDIGTDTKRANL